MSVKRRVFLSLSALLACACSGNPAAPPSVPDATPVTSRFSRDPCADEAYWLSGNPNVTTPACASTPVVRHHSFPVHRAEVVEINMAWIFREDYRPEYMWLDVHCGSVAATQAYAVNDSLSTYFPGPAPATRITNFIAESDYVEGEDAVIGELFLDAAEPPRLF